MLASAVSAFYG